MQAYCRPKPTAVSIIYNNRLWDSGNDQVQLVTLQRISLLISYVVFLIFLGLLLGSTDLLFEVEAGVFNICYSMFLMRSPILVGQDSLLFPEALR